MPPPPPVVHSVNLKQRYGTTLALDSLTLALPAGETVALIGPDGAGKSSLLSLIAGSRTVQEGWLEVLGGDMRDQTHRLNACQKIAYLPQGHGKNLYPALSAEENLQFFAQLFGTGPAERRRRIDTLADATGLRPFLETPAGKLSGSKKQLLGLCCALIHVPDLLILDEPTGGVGPLAKAQLWDLIGKIRKAAPTMSILIATACMEEARGCDWLVAMDAGKILAQDTPDNILEKTRRAKLEDAFIQLLPADKRTGYRPVDIPPLPEDNDPAPAIEARGLGKKFASVTAVDNVSFTVPRGEIFGILGANGCGKTTLLKMLAGLIPPSEGSVKLFGREVEAVDLETRLTLGYMSQTFSLHSELSVRQNLTLQARLFHIPEQDIGARVGAVAKRLGLDPELDSLPGRLPFGLRRRLSLAAAVVHNPQILILDEPTSGVDPLARDEFWHLIGELARQERVTVFLTTQFMNEAERCDRLCLMHGGRSLAVASPAALIRERGAATLEEACLGYLKEAAAAAEEVQAENDRAAGIHSGADDANLRLEPVPFLPASASLAGLSLTRLFACSWREALELGRDPLRLTLALLGTVVLMLVLGYGLNLDVANLTYAVLDRDDSALSRNYTAYVAASPFFRLQPDLASFDDLGRRMARGSLAMALVIPRDFGKDLHRGRHVAIRMWLDGSNPMRAEAIQGYLTLMHLQWLEKLPLDRPGLKAAGQTGLEVYFRYNPEVASLPAMVPALLAILLLLIPALFAALSVVREKKLGSILNLYNTPLTRCEFIIGKQIPYILLTFLCFLLLLCLAVAIFGVPVKGSMGALVLGAFLYACIATGIGFLTSTLSKSQTAVIILTFAITLLPASQFSGLLNSVSSLGGVGQFIGNIFPTTHMLTITRGVFNKALTYGDLQDQLLAMAVTIPVVATAAILCLKREEG